MQENCTFKLFLKPLLCVKIEEAADKQKQSDEDMKRAKKKLQRTGSQLESKL